MMKSKYFPQNNAFLLKNGQLHSFFNSKTKGTNMMIYNIYIYIQDAKVLNLSITEPIRHLWEVDIIA